MAEQEGGKRKERKGKEGKGGSTLKPQMSTPAKPLVSTIAMIAAANR
jgi:hypothetical protein